ncbi:MAG: TIGR02444 family protein [Pseudomonadales bacterium]|nr:TIGR02444 family protein [Pseudomonadales bacterium]
MSRQGGDFWQFSLRLYDGPSVAENCLRLQDEFDLDVNLLLFCCWSACRGVALTPALLRPAITFSAAWQQHLLAPLRHCRRWLKPGPDSEIDTLPRIPQEIRAAIKQLELTAEQYQQTRLADLLDETLVHASQPGDQDQPGLENPGSGSNRQALIQTNLAAYLAVSHTDLSAADNSLLQPLIETSLTLWPLPASHQS